MSDDFDIIAHAPFKTLTAAQRAARLPIFDHAARDAAYDAEMIRRYKAGEPLSRGDKVTARRLIKAAGMPA